MCRTGSRWDYHSRPVSANAKGRGMYSHAQNGSFKRKGRAQNGSFKRKGRAQNERFERVSRGGGGASGLSEPAYEPRGGGVGALPT